MGSIVVSNLGKAYKYYPNRFSRILEWMGLGQRHQLRWVLKHISFNVRPGEAVGIIGINGAGKSTLLKLITGTTQPTTGSVNISGRVAALLELGMGFHPDFTGRQNVYMAGQLLGLSGEEINRLIPEIEAFAEIGDYIDQPARVYSSGMQMRLAFSVATAVRPDVLIVDEALSVGDAYFQQKSFERIRAFRQQGTTLLIVSHDKGAIQSICDRAILLGGGEIAMEGQPEAVMDYYNAMLAIHQNQEIRQEVLEDGRVQTNSGTGEVVFEEVGLFNVVGEKVEVVNVGDRLNLKVTVKCNQDVAQLVLGYLIKDRLGQPVFGTNTFHLGEVLSSVLEGDTFLFVIGFYASIGPGTYSISLALHSGDTHIANNYQWKDLAVVFEIVNIDHVTFIGSSWIPCEVNVEYIAGQER